MDGNICILGTEYKIIFATEEEKESLTDLAGYMDFSIKEIVIKKQVKEAGSIDDLKSYENKVLRHEIIHAFIYESGLWENSNEVKAWAQCEEMTDWIAIQFHKIEAVFKELGI